MKDKFKPGTVAFTKTTEEPLFVMRAFDRVDSLDPIWHSPDYSLFCGTMVVVRRPIITDQGIKHVTETFLAEELQTTEEKQQRVYDEMAGVVRIGQQDKKPTVAN